MIALDLGRATHVTMVSTTTGADLERYIEHPVVSARYFVFTRVRDQERRVVDRNKAEAAGMPYAQAIAAAFACPMDQEALTAYNMIAAEEPAP